MTDVTCRETQLTEVGQTSARCDLPELHEVGFTYEETARCFAAEVAPTARSKRDQGVLARRGLCLPLSPKERTMADRISRIGLRPPAHILSGEKVDTLAREQFLLRVPRKENHYVKLDSLAGRGHVKPLGFMGSHNVRFLKHALRANDDVL